MKFFGKKSKKEKQGETESVDDFKDFLDKSFREEKTETVQNKRQENRSKSMAKVLLDNAFTIEEINRFCKSKKVYQVRNGELEEKV